MTGPDPRTAVVTGATGGYGSAVVGALRRAGCAVLAVVHETPAEPGPDLAAPLHTVRGDVTEGAYQATLSRALDALAWPALDLVVNAAGMVRFGTELAGAAELDVLSSVDVHCAGAMRTVRGCLPWLRRSDRATVINVTSRHASIATAVAGGYDGVPASYAYRIAKAAQNMLTACLHQEFAPRIRTLAVHPGQLRTAIGPPDADRSPRDAADDLVELLRSTPHTVSGVFLTAQGSGLSW